MAKRGRPRKIREPEAGNVAVADPPKAESKSPYRKPYPGRRWWVLAIKPDREREAMPCHFFAAGGVGWSRGTKKPVVHEGWSTLDNYVTRATRALLSSAQVEKTLFRIKNSVVRWRKTIRKTPTGRSESWAADIICLENRIKAINPVTREHEGRGYRHSVQPNDIPISKYLVMVPRPPEAKGNQSYDPDLEQFPTMFELDPSLVPSRMQDPGDGSFGEDEPW